MRQLFLFNEISRASNYGVGAYIKQLSSCLKDEFQIFIVNLYSQQLELTVKDVDNIKTIDIPCHQLKYSDTQCDENYFINCVYLVMEFVKEDSQPIFHFNYFRYKSILLLLKSYCPLCKIVFTVHYFDWCFFLDGSVERFKNILNGDFSHENSKYIYDKYKKDKEFVSEIDALICLSDDTHRIMKELYGVPEEKLVTVVNGLKDDAVFLSDAEKQKQKEALGFNSENEILLFVGRLDSMKGTDILLSLFKKIMKLRENCILVLVGDGDFSHYLREARYCWNRIIFTGKLQPEELRKFYQVADVGILLSSHEQCSYVLIEMMMHGIPVITSNGMGLKEMIKDGQNGYKLNFLQEGKNRSFDTEKYLPILLDALNSSCEMKRGSRECYEERYTLSLWHKNMLSVYECLF